MTDEDPPSHKADFKATPSLHFPLRSGLPRHRQLMVYQFALNPELSIRYVG
jgi:hypothetical protein